MDFFLFYIAYVFIGCLLHLKLLNLGIRNSFVTGQILLEQNFNMKTFLFTLRALLQHMFLFMYSSDI